jgi:formamidopyrimidine-DNA glycosylase
VPEGVEIEIYRLAAEAAVGKTIASIDASDSWFLKGDTTAEVLDDVMVGADVIGTDRVGKLLLLELDTATVGLRFGMTGRLLVSDSAPIEKLKYSSDKNDPVWDRFKVFFTDGTDMRIRDPRRLGGVELEPDTSKLGPDIFLFKPKDLDARVLVGDVAIKARLLDQSRLAGVGNLIADETLWRARIDPARPASTIAGKDRQRLIRCLRGVARDFLRDGGSHTGRLQSSRVRGGHCPSDGTALERRTIGGRTTYSCPDHQH